MLVVYKQNNNYEEPEPGFSTLRSFEDRIISLLTMPAPTPVVLPDAEVLPGPEA